MPELLKIILFIFYVVIFLLLVLYLVSQFWIDISNAKLKGKFGLPYVPTSKKRLRRIMELAELKDTDKVVDLGSGDGRIVIAAAKKGAQVDGYELNPVLVWWSRLKIKLLGLSNKAHIYRKDLFTADLENYNVFLLYTMPWVLDKIYDRLNNTNYDKIKVVSNTFKFGAENPIKSAEKEKIYLYEFKKAKT